MSTALLYSEDYLNANKGPQVLAIIITFPCLALVVVSLRLYTRFRIVSNPSYEEFAILVAVVRALLYFGTSFHTKVLVEDFQHCNFHQPRFP